MRLSAPNPQLYWGGVQFRISRDSRSVVYLGDQQSVGVNQLFAAPIDGSRATLLLSPLLPPSGGGLLLGFAPDSSRVFYTATRTPGVIELFASFVPASPEQRHAQRR